MAEQDGFLPDRLDNVVRVAELGADEGVRAAVAGEMALLDPGVRSSRERAERLLDEDFVEFGSSGRVWDRESMVAAMAGPFPSPMNPSRLSMSAVSVCRTTWCTSRT